MTDEKDTTLKKPKWLKVDVDWLHSLYDRLTPREVGFYIGLCNYALKNQGKISSEIKDIRRITKEDDAFIGAFLSEFEDDLLLSGFGHYVIPQVIKMMEEYASYCEKKVVAGRAGGLSKRNFATKSMGGTGTVVYLNGDPDAQ